MVRLPKRVLCVAAVVLVTVVAVGMAARICFVLVAVVVTAAVVAVAAVVAIAASGMAPKTVFRCCYSCCCCCCC